MGRLSYISFLWKSSNLHGLHSPFIYAFASNGIYALRTPRPPKNTALPKGMTREGVTLLYRIIAAFKISKMFVLGDDTAASTELLRAAGDAANTKPWFFSPLAPIPGGFELAYLNAGTTNDLLNLYRQALPNVNENSIIIIPSIHADEEAEAAWEALKKEPGVTVSADTYHLGFLFFKSGRPKQHFYIRQNNGTLLNAVLGIRNLWGLLG